MGELWEKTIGEKNGGNTIAAMKMRFVGVNEYLWWPKFKRNEGRLGVSVKAIVAEFYFNFFYGKMHMNEWIIVVVSWRFLNDWISMQACGFRWRVMRSIVAEFSNWNEWIKWLFSGDILIAEFERKHVDFGGVMIRIVAEFSNWNECIKWMFNGWISMQAYGF